MDIAIFCNIVMKVTSTTFAIFYGLKASQRSCPHSRGGFTQGCEHQEVRVMGATSESTEELWVTGLGCGREPFVSRPEL